jgi:acyl-coenzyme A synthetase/AMP-(fatty) acid ligase
VTDRLMTSAARSGRVAGRTGPQLWHARVAATPDKPFITGEGRTWSFAEADHEMRCLAGGLVEIGVQAGARVLCGMVNSPETLLVHAALRELRAVIVPLVPGLTLAELAFQIEHSQARILIVGDPIAAVLEPRLESLPGLDTVVVAEPAAPQPASCGTARLAELFTHPPRDPHPGEHDDRDPWAIFYTSGSTGAPKGVVLPAGALASAGAAYADRFGVEAEDTYILPTPMAHAVGGLTVQGMALYTGCRLVILDRFSPSRFWEQVQSMGATVSILFPAHLNLLLEVDRDWPAYGESSLRLLITHQWLEAFRRRFGVELALCWGMTETGAASAGSLPGYRGEHGEGYIGPGMDRVQLAVLDERGDSLPAGAEGEICVRHEHQMLGYLSDPAATGRAVVDGWVHSGDLGLLDEQGHLVFRGRIKNMIKRSGENISPEEIESVLVRHPSVLEALVLGVPDRLRTEEVAAIVVLRQGAGVGADELGAFAAQSLARFKAPRYVAVQTEPLPRLAAGKVDRQAILRELDLSRCWDREAGRRR